MIIRKKVQVYPYFFYGNIEFLFRISIPQSSISRFCTKEGAPVSTMRLDMIHDCSCLMTSSQIKTGPNQLMEYSISSANSVLTKCFDITALPYLPLSPTLRSKAVVPITTIFPEASLSSVRTHSLPSFIPTICDKICTHIAINSSPKPLAIFPYLCHFLPVNQSISATFYSYQFR